LVSGEDFRFLQFTSYYPAAEGCASAAFFVRNELSSRSWKAQFIGIRVHPRGMGWSDRLKIERKQFGRFILCRLYDDFRIFATAQVPADFFVDHFQRPLHVLDIFLCGKHLAVRAGKRIDADIFLLCPPGNGDGILQFFPNQLCRLYRVNRKIIPKHDGIAELRCRPVIA